MHTFFTGVLLLFAIVIAGCGKKIDQKAIEKKVSGDWRHCERVVPEKITIDSNDGKTVRYSYVLRMAVDGDAYGYTCYVPNIAMLEALANKNLVQLKAGMEIPVTQEVSAK